MTSSSTGVTGPGFWYLRNRRDARTFSPIYSAFHASGDLEFRSMEKVANLVDRFDDMVSAVNGLLGLGPSVDATSADLIREVSRAMDQLADSTEEASKASAGLAGFDS